jgi:type I restriction enzyme S subunit
LLTLKKGEQKSKVFLSKTGEYPVYSGGIRPSGYFSEFNTLGNTIAISEGGNSCGYVHFRPENFWSGGHCYTLENLKDRVQAKFLFYFLKANERQIQSLRVGSGLPNIQKKDLSKFKVLLPSVKEQRAIAKILTKADQEIVLYKRKLAKLEAQKKGLMQQLLTGQKRLSA